MTTYYVDGAVGNDANLGTSEGAGNAWATIGKAASTVALGDTVYIKASATYAEDVTFVTIGNSTNPIRFIGYSTTPGDHGQITVTPTVSAFITALGSMYHIMMNIIVSGGTSHGWDFPAGDNNVFYNCKALNCGGKGWNHDNSGWFIRCTAQGCGDNGIWTDFNSTAHGCILNNNAPVSTSEGQFHGSSYDAAFNLAHGTSTESGFTGSCLSFICNTGYGEGSTTNDFLGNNGGGAMPCYGNVASDWRWGLQANTANPLRFVGYNGFFSNSTSDYSNLDGFPEWQGLYDVAGTPDEGFLDKANDDFRLAGTSSFSGTGLEIGDDSTKVT